MASGECFVALAEPFTAESPEARDAQEYAGRLFLQLKPIPPYGAKETTRQLLSKWDVSVEQLPWYLEAVLGADAFAGALLELESTSEVSPQVIETVRFWLRVPLEQRG